MVRIRMHLLARQVDCAKAKELQIRPSVWQGSIGAAAALSHSNDTKMQAAPLMSQEN